MLGANLPQNFPVIDRFVSGVATSIKTLDLNAATYQNISALTGKVRGYI
jgi:filamentous hemagglutinin